MPPPPHLSASFLLAFVDQPTVQDINWLANSIPNMQQNFAAGAWDDDDLLQYVLENLDQDDFYHQSHSLIHLSRDQLRASDCNAEDAGEMRGEWALPTVRASCLYVAGEIV